MPRLLSKPDHVWALECVPSIDVPILGGRILLTLRDQARAEIERMGHDPDAWQYRDLIEWSCGDWHAIEVHATTHYHGPA